MKIGFLVLGFSFLLGACTAPGGGGTKAPRLIADMPVEGVLRWD